MGAGGMGVALVNNLTQVVLKRMTPRETRAVVSKSTAEAEGIVLDTWMRAVLAPTEARAVRAEDKADEALATLDRFRDAIDAHQAWDLKAATAIRDLGGTIDAPPPLHIPRPRPGTP